MRKKANAKMLSRQLRAIKLTGYAISNLPNKTNVMQQWTDEQPFTILPTGITYIQPTTEFGTKTLLQNYNYFNAVTTDKSQKDYVFENNTRDAATSMYFEYTVKLKVMTITQMQTSRMVHSIVTTTLFTAESLTSSMLTKIKRAYL